MDPERAPIFIIGTGRSGTTLLRNILNAHPRIHIAFESHFYWWASIYRKRRPASELLDFYFQTPHFRWLRIDPARVRAELPEPLSRDRLGPAFTAILRERAARCDRVRFGDKTPAHVTCLKRIYADFPDARVIHIIRDPRATTLSLSRMPWAPKSLLINACYVDIERKQVAKFADRMLHIRLEDLLAEPRRIMTGVLAYVGEPWDEAVLDHTHHQPELDDPPPYPWLAGASQDRVVPTAPYGDLSPVQIRMIEEITKRVLRDAGYARAELATEPRWHSVFWAGIREIPLFLRYFGMVIPLMLKARDPRRLDEAEREWIHRINPEAWARYPGYQFPSAPPQRALPASPS